MEAVIRRGKYKGRQVKISQWCNDWFTIDARECEGLTDEEKIRLTIKPFSPSSLAFTTLGMGEIIKHKNNGMLFYQFEFTNIKGFGKYFISFKRK